jgi:hypothetical protein
MGGLDEWLPPAYLGLRLGTGYRNRLTDRAGLDYRPPNARPAALTNITPGSVRRASMLVCGATSSENITKNHARNTVM